MNDANQGPQYPEHPQGAMALTLLYLAAVVGGWCLLYYTLLQRGVTQ